MSLGTLQPDEKELKVLEKDTSAALLGDPRWQLIERIVRTEPFQKSTRLPAVLLYLARHTLNGDRHKLTEQAIGQSVFGKRNHYSPAEDSTVRVYVRQLRLRLHEYYHSPEVHEELIVSIPKGGYALDFSPTHVPRPVIAPPAVEAPPVEVSRSRWDAKAWLAASSALLLPLAVFLGLGWYREAATHQPVIPWPVNAVIHKGANTTLVMADAGFALRGFGDNEVSLDSYIAHNYLEPLLPKHMSENEAGVIRYFDSSRFTSNADAQAAAALSALAGPYADNLLLRSARDVNANDLTHGDFIFIGSKASNPWVELFEPRMNFQMVETGPNGSRYIVNRNPRAGEQKIYQGEPIGTLASGNDYGVIAFLPPKAGGGSTLIVEGVRMEGTKAAIAILQSQAGREKLQSKLAALNAGRPPQYFEALLHAQSVAGATMSVDVIAARLLQ